MTQALRLPWLDQASLHKRKNSAGIYLVASKTAEFKRYIGEALPIQSLPSPTLVLPVTERVQTAGFLVEAAARALISHGEHAQPNGNP